MRGRNVSTTQPSVLSSTDKRESHGNTCKDRGRNIRDGELHKDHTHLEGSSEIAVVTT